MFEGDEGRNISVRMFDDMRYDPGRFDGSVGETVTFDVTNSGQARHEFVVGTLDDHRAHAGEMREGGHGDDAHDNPAALRLEPGENGSLNYTFPEAGELLVGPRDRADRPCAATLKARAAECSL